MGSVAGKNRAGVAGIIHEIRAEIGRCQVCLGMRPWRKLAPESFGTTATGYMLVGEAPGFGPRALDDGKVDVVRDALSAVGDQRFRDLEDLFYLADAVRCTPVDRLDLHRRRTPSRRECSACRDFLEMEMRALRPRLVLAFGGKAAEAVLGRPVRIEEEHGRRQRASDVEVMPLLMPTPHNRAALHRRGMTLESYRTWLTGLFGALIDTLGAP